MFETKGLPERPDVAAPDGCEVRVLLGTTRGGMAHFELAAGQTSVAVRHRTVEEIWWFVSGRGEMWRRHGGVEEVVEVSSDTCITIPLGTAFQLRAHGATALSAVAVTMPPWPGHGEAIRVEGRWSPTLSPGPGLVDE